MRALLITLLLAFAAPVFAGDSGHYFDQDRVGEGLLLFRSGDFVQFGFFTYTAWQGCPGITIPYYTLLNEENCNFPRWFISAGDSMHQNGSGADEVTGDLLMGFGFNYPDGIGVFGDPFAVNVGDGFKVGTYTLERYENGWRMSVDRFSGSPLAADDPIYGMVFRFRNALVRGTD